MRPWGGLHKCLGKMRIILQHSSCPSAWALPEESSSCSGATSLLQPSSCGWSSSVPARKLPAATCPVTLAKVGIVKRVKAIGSTKVVCSQGANKNIILKDRCCKILNKIRRLPKEQRKELTSLRKWANFFYPTICCVDWGRNLSKESEGETDSLFLQKAGEFLSCFSTHQLTCITLNIFLTLEVFLSCQILDHLALLIKKNLLIHQLQNL